MVTFEELLKIWEPYRGLTIPPVQTVTFWSAGGCGRFESESAAIAAYRDAGVERADGVGERRTVKAGMKFFRDGPAANHFAALEHQRLEAAFGEIKSGDERVVPAANENHALSDGHG